jgi:hypothetical protein
MQSTKWKSLNFCHSTKRLVILSEAKDLRSHALTRKRILRFVRMTILFPMPIAHNPASILDLGSSKSRNASPIKLKASTANITVTAGKSTR